MLIKFNGGEPGAGKKKFYLKRREDFHLANVDLEIASADDLRPLLDELEAEDKAMSLYHQGFDGASDAATLEIGSYPSQEEDWVYENYNDTANLVGGADALISAFCALLENLSPAARRLWDRCTRKEFDIGFTAGNTMKSFHTQIRAETVKRSAALGASILITVYPHFDYQIRDDHDPLSDVIDEPLTVTEKTIEKLTGLRGEPKFTNLPGFESDLETIRLEAAAEQARLAPILDDLLDRLIAEIQARPSKLWVLEQFQRTLEIEQSEDFKTRRIFNDYFHQILDYLEIESTDGLLGFYN